MQKNPTKDHSFCQILYFEPWRSALITLKPFLNEISGQNLWDKKKVWKKTNFEQIYMKNCKAA